MNKFKIILGATALAVATVAIVACSKEKTAQQETPAAQQTAEPQDYTLAEMAEAMSWEDGKAFFENQTVKDYTAVCEKVVNDCEFAEKEAGSPYIISWVWKMPNGMCNSSNPGLCLVIRKENGSSMQANALGYFEDGKLVIVPITAENGFTADGYLVIGAPIEVQYDSIVIQEGIYMAYYDEEAGRYTAVAVDYYRSGQ
ncbi:MAG: hypothetical protein IKW82_08940 [Bacteroidales bacterium]|nr:hypothetical protein [Bacteroidales bacterium]